jgi:hypothetical protein
MAVPQSQADLLQLKQELETEIEKYLKGIRKKQRYHHYMNNSLVVASILISGTIAVMGMINMGLIAAVLAILLSALLALQQVFPFADMAFFYRSGVADLENIQLSLAYSDGSRKVMDRTIVKFKIVRKHLAEAIPKGNQALNTIMTMRDELKRNQ